MVPAHATIEFQTVFLFIVDIDTKHLRGIQSLTLTSPSASTASTRETHIIHIVSTRKEHHLHVILHHSTHTSACITVLSTYGKIDIGHQTAIHTFLDTEVEDSLLLTILDARDTRQIALLIIGTDAFNDVRGQVLQGRLRITRHELLTIDENLLDLLTIDLDSTIVADLSTREALDEFFYD